MKANDLTTSAGARDRPPEDTDKAGASRPSYLDYILHFWRLRQQQPFSSVAADLYSYLLWKANLLAWKNPFQEGNPIILASLGISDKTLMGAREKLVAAGLLRFIPGKKGSYSTYELLHPENNTENLRSIRELSGSNEGAIGEQSGGNPPSNNRIRSRGRIKEANASASAPVNSISTPPPPPTEPWAVWVAANAPDVQRMRQPLTAEQWARLVEEFGETMVREVLLALHNTTGAEKKYKSANLTARAWCLRRCPDGQPPPRPVPRLPTATPTQTEPALNEAVTNQRQAEAEARAAERRQQFRQAHAEPTP